MSLAFNATSTENGIIQLIERNCGYESGAISGNTTLMAQTTSDVNQVMSYIWGKIFAIAGWNWGHDDTNSTASEGYPTVSTNLVSGTRVYSFTVDAASTPNLIVDIRKVLIANSDGVFFELIPSDVMLPLSDSELWTDGQTHSGTPTYYSKNGKNIAFDLTPDYSVTGGIKLIVEREGVQFLTSDTTAKPGFWPLGHEYIPTAVSYKIACRKSLANEKSLYEQMLRQEAEILNYYGGRGKDVPRVMSNKPFHFR